MNNQIKRKKQTNTHKQNKHKPFEQNIEQNSKNRLVEFEFHSYQRNLLLRIS